MTSFHKKLLGLLLILFSVVILVLFYFAGHNTSDNNSTDCITNKDQAIDLLLGTNCDDCVAETETATYVKEVEARGNKVFFDERPYPLGATGESISYNSIDIGEELKNGSKLLHSRYSYKVNTCDIDLDQEEIALPEKQTKFQFSFINGASQTEQFIDETNSCSYYDPTTELADFDGDGQNEILVNCFSGGSSNLSNLYIYKLKGDKLVKIGQMSTEREPEIKDCSGDSTKDSITYMRDIPYPDGNSSLATWKVSVYCNHWEQQNNKFIETKIAEE
jgi:hypothetical protein